MNIQNLFIFDQGNFFERCSLNILTFSHPTNIYRKCVNKMSANSSWEIITKGGVSNAGPLTGQFQLKVGGT